MLQILYDSIMMLPGEGEAYDSCVEVVGWKKCPVCGYSEPMTQNCGRVTCPECYTHWVKKSAKRVSARIHGFSETAKALAKSNDERNLRISQTPISRIAYSARKCRHLVISPPKDVLTEDMGLAKTFDIFSKHIKKYFPDLIAGEIVFHPFRIREEVRLRLIDYCKQKQIDEPSYSSGGFWKLARDDVLNLGSFDAYRVFSPHAHVICFGRFPYADEYYEQTGGWVYKNVRDLPLEITVRDDGTHNDAVNTVFSYLLTHCCVEINENGRVRKCHRSFGLMSPRYFRRADGYCIIIESTLKCPDCLEKGDKNDLIILPGEVDELPKVKDLVCCWYEKPKDDVEYAYSSFSRVPVHTKIPNYDLHNPKPRKHVERFEQLPPAVRDGLSRFMEVS